VPADKQNTIKQDAVNLANSYAANLGQIAKTNQIAMAAIVSKIPQQQRLIEQPTGKQKVIIPKSIEDHLDRMYSNVHLAINENASKFAGISM